jgi:hypothetical protein
VDGQERILPGVGDDVGYSRFTGAVMIPSRKADDILAGMWELIGGWRRCPRTLVRDREAAIGGTGKSSDAKELLPSDPDVDPLADHTVTLAELLTPTHTLGSLTTSRAYPRHLARLTAAASSTAAICSCPRHRGGWP